MRVAVSSVALRIARRIGARIDLQIALQIALQIKSGEDAAWLRQSGQERRGVGKCLTLDARENRLVRDAEQSPALLRREFGAGRSGSSDGGRSLEFRTLQTAWTSRFLRRARTKDRRRRFSDLRSIRDQKATK